jgi:hypothetical protein
MKSGHIQKAQLEALGAKTRVETQLEREKASHSELQSLLLERQAELNRY